MHMQNHAILHQPLSVAHVRELFVQDIGTLKVREQLLKQDVCGRSTVTLDLLFIFSKQSAKPWLILLWGLHCFRDLGKQGKVLHYFGYSHLVNYNIIERQMDPNERKRKAPPLPKFQPESKAKDPSVVEKVADFLQEISKDVSAQQAPEKVAAAPPNPQ